jgi:hypothetical protein
MRTSLTSTEMTLMPPWLGAYVDDLLKFTADFFSSLQHVRKYGFPDHVAQSRLGGPTNGAAIVGNVECRLVGIQNFPKQHGIDIDRDRIFREISSDVETGRTWMVSKPFLNSFGWLSKYFSANADASIRSLNKGVPRMRS